MLISLCPKVSNGSLFPKVAAWERPVDKAKQNRSLVDFETEVNLEEACGFSFLVAFFAWKGETQANAGVCGLALSV